MIDKAGLLQQVLSNLQRSESTRTTVSVPVAEPAPGAEAARSAPAAVYGGLALDHRIRERIAKIDPHDPQRRRRALRVIVEASLLTEFGERLDSDPAFHALVDQVAQIMDEDTVLAGLVDDAVAGLAR